jgi:hypothetical protein
MYSFMHKGEFYTLLPKDAEDIKCTIEVFKTKSARHRLKPRTVSLQGREDDAVISIAIDNSMKAARYVVPSRRREREVQTTTVFNAKNDPTQLTQMMVDSVPIQITPNDEVPPRSRTPSAYIMVGQIAIKF